MEIKLQSTFSTIISYIIRVSEIRSDERKHLKLEEGKRIKKAYVYKHSPGITPLLYHNLETFLSFQKTLPLPN